MTLGWVLLPLLSSAANITVSTTADTVNGNVSSPEALNLNPGPDGISLRESILAANNVPGPHTITFSPLLAGQTITLTNQLPTIRRNGVTITGLTSADGQPALTLDPGGTQRDGFTVRGSEFTLIHMRIIRVRSGVEVRAGAASGDPTAPNVVENIRIEDNVFSNVDVNDKSFGLIIAHNPGSSGAIVRDVKIARNQFVHYQRDGDAVMFQAEGAGNLIQDVSVENNDFSETDFPVELVHDDSSDSGILRVTIAGNTFTRNNLAISLGAQLSGNYIKDTVISRNIFHDNAIAVIIGPSGRNNVVSTTVIERNRVSGGGAIIVFGASGPGAGNRVEKTLISGNVATTSNGIYIIGGSGSAMNNVVTGNRVENNRGFYVEVNGGSGSSAGNRVEQTVISGNVSFRAALRVKGGSNTASGNMVFDTRVVNNVISAIGDSLGAGNVVGGQDSATGNRVEKIRIINNTVTRNPSRGIGLVPNVGNATGNTLADVSIANTIFWGNAGGDMSGATPDQVRYCVTSDAQFRGVNGNVSADPKFVNPEQGDFYLQPGSPAIDAGSSDEAPAKDLEGRDRFDDPATPNRGAGQNPYYDIGAFEFNGPVAPFGISAVVNSASFVLGMVPGSLATVFGRGLTLLTGTVLGGEASAEGISVKANGRSAPVLSMTNQAGREQVNVQVPFDLPSAATATLEIDNNGTRFSSPAVPLFESQPAIFEIVLDAEGTRAGAVVHLNGTLVTPANPATVGEIVSMFLTGAGPVEPAVATGVPGPAPPSYTKLPTVVGVADAGARVLFSGYAPQAIGLYQINFEIPSGIATGPSIKLNVKIGNSFSRASSIAIQPN